MKIIRLNNVLAVRLETEKRYKLANWSMYECRAWMHLFNCFDCSFSTACLDSETSAVVNLNLLLKGTTL